LELVQKLRNSNRLIENTDHDGTQVQSFNIAFHHIIIENIVAYTNV